MRKHHRRQSPCLSSKDQLPVSSALYAMHPTLLSAAFAAMYLLYNIIAHTGGNFKSFFNVWIFFVDFFMRKGKIKNLDMDLIQIIVDRSRKMCYDIMEYI